MILQDGSKRALIVIPCRAGHRASRILVLSHRSIWVGRRRGSRGRRLRGRHRWLWPCWRRRIGINDRIRGSHLRGRFHRGHDLRWRHRECGHVLCSRCRRSLAHWSRLGFDGVRIRSRQPTHIGLILTQGQTGGRDKSDLLLTGDQGPIVLVSPVSPAGGT